MFCKKSGLVFLFVAINIGLIGGNIRFTEKPTEVSPPKQLNVTGLVTVDGLPVSSDIQINSLLKNDKSFLKIHGAESNGLFTLNLPKGDIYEIVIEVKHFPPQVIELNTVNIDSTLALNAYADFTSPAYDKKLEELIRSIEQKTAASKVFNKPNFELNFGNRVKDQLTYRIQVGAFKFFENFNYNTVIGMPKIIRQTDKDYITRFTMGNFNSYNEAQLLLEQLQKNKLPDAFIIAMYNGEKKFLQQLLDEKILE